MSHLVLYRNFRPKNFDEVIGQEHIVKTLKNQVEQKSFGHAYLFCGTRGTGKTSTAKIFARAINCENPQNGNPCEKCSTCISNQNSENLDIVEIDAASNNRVDEIRDLREKIGYLPSVNKYKVYIVDEVHMLTESAFNALLKTLEEPPEHAIFILATTEPHKLPATILSRCMRFDFKLVSEQDLINHLKYVFDKSNIKYDEESLKLIAQSGEGSVRDTLSVAEMCSAYCLNNISYDKCLECLGVTDTETLLSIIDCLASKNTEKLIENLESLKTQGKNFAVIVKDLTKALNSMLTMKISSKAKDILSLPEKVFEKYSSCTNKIEASSLLEFMQTLAELDYKMKTSSSVEMLVETTLLSMLVKETEIEKLKQKVFELEKKTLDEDDFSNFGEKNQKKTEILNKNLKKIENIEQISENNADTNYINSLQNSNNGSNHIDKTFVNRDFEQRTEAIKNQNIETKKNQTAETKESQSVKNQENKVNLIKEELPNLQFDNDSNFQHKENDEQMAKKLFGELLVLVRKSNDAILYSMLGDVQKVEKNGSDLILSATKFTFDSLVAKQKLLNEFALQMDGNLTISLKLIADNENVDLKEFLKDKFENDITII